MKISEKQLLKGVPPHIVESKLLTQNDKLVLGALVDYELHSPAKGTGVIYIANAVLRNIVGIRNADLYESFRNLESFQLIEREAGKSRTKGEKAEASRYTINYDKFADELEEVPLWKRALENAKKRQALNTSETPLGTAYNISTYNIIKDNKIKGNEIKEKERQEKPITDNVIKEHKSKEKPITAKRIADTYNNIPNYITEIGEVYKRNDLRNILEYYQKEIVEEQDERNVAIIKQLINNFDFIDDEDKEIFINRIEGWRNRDNSTSYVEATTSEPNDFDDFPF